MFPRFSCIFSEFIAEILRYSEKLQKRSTMLKKNTDFKLLAIYSLLLSFPKLLPSTGWHFHKL